jgi:hypothetical protein
MALLSLGGYRYFTRTSSKNCVGLYTADKVSDVLNVYQTPPTSDVLLNRIKAAINKRQTEIVERRLTLNRNRRRNHILEKKMIEALNIQEWRSWISKALLNEPIDNHPIAKNPKSEPVLVSSNPKNPSNQDPPKPTSAKDNHQKKRRRRNTSTTKKPSPKQNSVMPFTNKNKQVHANSMGSLLTVQLPSQTQTSNGEKDMDIIDEGDSATSETIEQELNDAMSIDWSDVDNDFSDCLEKEDKWISYDDLKEHHYQHNPKHHHDDDHCYYKGFQHLCCLRKAKPLSGEPYQALSSQKRFTNEAFHDVFGANPEKKGTSYVNNATTHVLNRFESDSGVENPVIGIKYEALSQSIVDTIINIARTKEFLKDQAGKYIRAATTEPCEGYRVPHFPDMDEYSNCDRMYPLFRIGQKKIPMQDCLGARLQQRKKPTF